MIKPYVNVVFQCRNVTVILSDRTGLKYFDYLTII